jgi:hypothetical protein
MGEPRVVIYRFAAALIASLMSDSETPGRKMHRTCALARELSGGTG